jgi:hypothetical protein
VKEKPKGTAWAYVASGWRKYTSYRRSSEELVAALAERGFLSADWNKGIKPAQPTRKDILRAMGREEETNDGSC